MSWPAYIACYLGVGYLVMALFALRDIPVDARVLFVIALGWPMLIVFVPWALIEPKVPYRCNVEVRRDLSPFGVRRPIAAWGIALRAVWIEFQVWRVRRK